MPLNSKRKISIKAADTSKINDKNSVKAQTTEVSIEPSFLTQYMKKQYDRLIETKINNLILRNEQTIANINENIVEILKIYDQRSKYCQLSYNITDEKTKNKNEAFFDNFKNIVKYVYKTIYDGDTDEKFVEKITAKLFSSNNQRNQNLKAVICSLFQIDNSEDYIKKFANYIKSQQDFIAFQTEYMGESQEIDIDTNITFKLSDKLNNFNNTFAWDFFTRDCVHRCVVNKWLREYNKSSNENCLKNYLTIIYRIFYSFQFFNNVEDDEYNDAKKANNKKIEIIQHISTSTSTLVPYAPVTVTSGNTKSWYNKVSFLIKPSDTETETETKEPNIQFNQKLTTLIKADKNITTTVNNIKVCSYNLNWSNSKSKIISNHNNNILGSDIILLQEFNINNTEILNERSKFPIGTIKLMFSKDVHNILHKGSKNNVIANYYNKEDNNYNILKSTLNNTYVLNSNYDIIYFPNRVSKDSNVKLNAIMYDTSKITIDEVFVGLLDPNKYLKYRHFCLCCKYIENENVICVINIHLDTDYGKKIQISEIKYLFSEIIRKEPFFRNIDRYIIGGDFNIDAYDIAIELIKIQKNFKKKQHELASFHKKILFNNIVTRGGLFSCDPRINKDKAKYNGMNLDNIIIFDRNIIDDNSINTYVGYNRKSEKITQCDEIEDSQSTSNTHNQKKLNFSDHSPIFAVFPKMNKKQQNMDIEQSKSQSKAQSKANSSVVEEKRNIQLLSEKNKLKLLLDILKDFNAESEEFKGKYISILREHIDTIKTDNNKRQRVQSGGKRDS